MKSLREINEKFGSSAFLIFKLNENLYKKSVKKILEKNNDIIFKKNKKKQKISSKKKIKSFSTKRIIKKNIIKSSSTKNLKKKKVLSIKEKIDLKQKIKNLSPEELKEIIKIIKKEKNDFSQNENFIFDLNLLNSEILLELKEFVDKSFKPCGGVSRRILLNRKKKKIEKEIEKFQKKKKFGNEKRYPGKKLSKSKNSEKDVLNKNYYIENSEEKKSLDSSFISFSSDSDL